MHTRFTLPLLLLLASACAPPRDPLAATSLYADCNPALAGEMVEDGALVIEVRDDGARASVPGALSVAPEAVLTSVERASRARCGVVVLSVGGGSGRATSTLRSAGYEATDLGEAEAWRYVPRGARAAVASTDRPPCSR